MDQTHVCTRTYRKHIVRRQPQLVTLPTDTKIKQACTTLLRPSTTENGLSELSSTMIATIYYLHTLTIMVSQIYLIALCMLQTTLHVTETQIRRKHRSSLGTNGRASRASRNCYKCFDYILYE